jgi:phage baseplate assembly protein V
VRDSVKLQAVQVRLSGNEVRDDIERIQEYGFSSVPLPGAEGVALAVGGNRDHLVIVAMDDRRYRPTGQAGGEVSLYNHTGASVALKADGSIVVVAAGTGKAKIGGATLTQALPTEAFAAAVCTALNTLSGGTFPATPDLIPFGLTTKTEAL